MNATPLSLGPVMIDIEGLELTKIEADKINHPNTGAVILFARNYSDPEQITELISNIRAARNGRILIAVDQEGGRVQRFQRGFTRLPPAACYAKDSDRCIALAESAGWLMAAELLAVGVDFSFAPVLDIDRGVSEVIGNRSFSSNPELATRVAASFRNGMNTAGMAAVGKHFPGHGAVAADSHLALPIDGRDLSDIRTIDLQPFRTLIHQGLEGIMPAHVIYPKVDSNPAGFSSIWIQQILRTELGFNGAVFSDDLSMQGAAAAGDFIARARLAQHAGCDMILVCNNAGAAEQVLDATPVEQIPERDERLHKMFAKQQPDRQQLMKSRQWRQISLLISAITEGQ